MIQCETKFNHTKWQLFIGVRPHCSIVTLHSREAQPRTEGGGRIYVAPFTTGVRTAGQVLILLPLQSFPLVSAHGGLPRDPRPGPR